MLMKNDFLRKYPDIHEKTIVRTLDGEKLGKISAMNEDSFTVQKGFFFPRDFMFRYEDIVDFQNDELIVSSNQSDLSEWRDTSYTGWSQVDEINAGRMQATPRPEFMDRYRARTTEDVQVPVMEEQMEAQKTMRQTGELRIRKLVHTELKHFTVPVTKEEVRIERVAVGDKGATLPPGERAFEEKTINVPIMEEEVTVTKRPVVKEEIRLHKERTEQQREVSGEIRKEEVQIEGEDALKKQKKTA
jgi:uncharacterized protein (TIGR02271 family)